MCMGELCGEGQSGGGSAYVSRNTPTYENIIAASLLGDLFAQKPDLAKSMESTAINPLARTMFGIKEEPQNAYTGQPSSLPYIKNGGLAFDQQKGQPNKGISGSLCNSQDNSPALDQFLKLGESSPFKKGYNSVCTGEKNPGGALSSDNIKREGNMLAGMNAIGTGYQRNRFK